MVVPLVKFLVVNDFLRENLFKFVYWVAFFIPFGYGKGVLVALLLWSSRIYGLRLKIIQRADLANEVAALLDACLLYTSRCG